MSTLASEVDAQAIRVTIKEEELAVDLVDGRTIIVPLGWYPRLIYGSVKERKNWRLIGKGAGIHWPDLDEDVSVMNLLAGRPSGESQSSFKKWLERRGSPRKKR